MTWLYLWPLQRYNHQMNTELYNYTHVQTHTQMIGRKRMITMKKEKETGEERYLLLFTYIATKNLILKYPYQSIHKYPYKLISKR